MDSDTDEKFAPIGDSFCVYPFLELTVAPGGQVKPCCAFSQDIEIDGRAVSVYEYSIAEIWNSEPMRNIRRLMTVGQPVEGCAYCYGQVRQKFRSIWEDANDSYEAGWLNPRNETLSDLKQRAISSNFALPNGPERLDLDVGNLCNLKCRMCHSGSSSSVAADQVQIRWPHSFSRTPSPARWSNLETVIAPHVVLGVSYEGLSDIDWSNATPTAWTNGRARMITDISGMDLAGIAITIDQDRPVDQRLRLLVNSSVIYDGVPEPGLWSRSFSIAQASMSDQKLQISIESSCHQRSGHSTETGVGIQRLALVRSSNGRNSISIGRFASGQQWFQNREFIESDLFYDLPSITKINFIGGEPLLIKEVRKIMRYLISTGRAKDITLSMTTNGTVMDEEWNELAVQFRSLIIAVSLDGYRELNNYIRYPSKWETIQANISRLQEIPNAYVYVNMTIQPYNMLRITELIDYCETAGLDFRHHAVVEPHQLNCNGMPDEIRAIAATRLRRYAMRNQGDRNRPNRFVDYRKGILSLAEALESPSSGDKARAVREFMIFTNDLDQSRQQNFSEVGSELIALLKEQGYPWISETRFAEFAAGNRSLGRISLSERDIGLTP